MAENKIKITPHFPTYEQVRLLLPVLHGLKVSDVKALIPNIYDQTGTPQNPVDWSNPEKWIPERLNQHDAQLAKAIWEKSNNKVNPRQLEGIYGLIIGHSLAVDDNGIFSITLKGRLFKNKDEATIKEIDSIEGVSYLLSFLATLTRAQKKDLLCKWANFLKKSTDCSSMATYKSSLWQRLRNLRDRNMVMREGAYYVITKEGLDYVKESAEADPYRKVYQSISWFNEKGKVKLRKLLEGINSYRFVHLVRELLEAMGYEDITVISQSGDKGVDVVATIQLGVTNIAEVVQVRRHKGFIVRQTVDQLRGALPYHKAIRGTIITLSDFSKGCREAALFPGAVPITLINGKKMIDLIFKHELGIHKQSVDLFEVDESFFQEPTGEDEIPSPSRS